MSDKIKFSLGILLITLLSTGIVYVYMENHNVKIRVDKDKSTFLVLEDSRWRVAGVEYNKLFDGTSRSYRDVSDIYTETVMRNESGIYYFRDGKIVNNSYLLKDNNLKINDVYKFRYTPYIKGPIIIDKYYFNGDIKDVELFPISHTVKIYNGTGYFYRYEVRNLVYDGERQKLDITSMSFGRNMKVEWQDNYRWAWIYANGVLSIQYDINSDYEEYQVRLFDPEPVTNTSRMTPTPIAVIDEDLLAYCNASDTTINNLSYEYIFYVNNVTNISYDTGDTFTSTGEIHNLSSLKPGTPVLEDLYFFEGFWYILDTHPTSSIFKLDSDFVSTGFSYSLNEDNQYQSIFRKDDFWYILGSQNDKVYKYDDSFIYTGTSFSVTNEDTNMAAIYWNNTNWYMVGSSNDKIYVYNESFNYTGINFSVSGQDFAFSDLTKFNNKWYVGGTLNNNIYVYDSNFTYTGESIPIITSGFNVVNDFVYGVHLENATKYFSPRILYNESIEINLINISSEKTLVDEEWVFSCRAYNGTNYSSWLNSSITKIITIDLNYILNVGEIRFDPISLLEQNITPVNQTSTNSLYTITNNGTGGIINVSLCINQDITNITIQADNNSNFTSIRNLTTSCNSTNLFCTNLNITNVCNIWLRINLNNPTLPQSWNYTFNVTGRLAT